MAIPRLFDTGPLVVGHRGASEAEPENTLPAFEAAVAAGADVIEVDVRLTADGVPVILHDPDVARSTDGTGPVHTLRLEELKRFDASGGRGDPAEVPTLAEVLELLDRHDRVGLNLEIKNLPGEPAFDSPKESTLEAALDVLDRAGFSHPVVVSSFNWLTIERCRERAPEILTGFLTIAAIEPKAALVYAREAGHDLVLPQVPALLAAGPAFVEQAHETGMRVGTWVADDEETLEALFRLGADAVASNRPDRAAAVRDRVSGRA